MNLVERAKNILISPSNEWEVIKGESTSVSEMFTKYALLLALIPAIAGFIGYSVFGINFGFGSYKIPIGTGILWAVLTYVLNLAGIFIIGFVVDALAPSFSSTKDMVASMKVVIFAYTAAWVAGIFSIIPVLSFIGIIGGVYSLVLMYMGLQRVKDVPKDKMIGYFIVILIVAIVVYMIIAAIVGAIAFSGMAISGMHY